MVFVKWMDTREVSVCLTIHAAHAGDTVRRKVKSRDGRYSTVEIPCPIPVVQYNKYMGGVDRSDQLIQYYSAHRRVSRPYCTLFLHFFDIANTNAYIIHLELAQASQQKALSHKAFLLQLAGELCQVEPSGVPGNRQTTHLPVGCAEEVGNRSNRATVGRRRCQHCSAKGIRNCTPWKCQACGVPLCLQLDRNCARPVYTQPPATAHPFFQRPFFLWMPYRMWAYNFCCPTCGGKLVYAGLYETVRRVLDMSGWYFMATECLECSSCHKKVAGWSHDVLEQLDITHREEFPAVLTYQLSCDRAVIGLLKKHSLGYSVSRLHASLVKQHTREWMARSTSYLSVLRKLRAPGAAPQVVTLPTMHQVPDVPSLMSVYARDALMRLKETKARVTSIFGDILSIDSTRKVTKNFVGASTGTPAWTTNVGNEYGQVLMSVLTAAKGDGLADMAAGLVQRYRNAEKAPPKVMYVDRECCATEGPRKTKQLFHEWHELVIRLDPWHLMRQFARGVTSDSHQLYGLFMARLSLAIFEWDAGDLGRLREAKQSEEGSRDVKLSARELVRHCRRRTRGVAETERLLLQVLVTFCKAKDSTGAPLIDQTRMKEIWSTQRRHLRCIQDPAGVELYILMGEVNKGGVKLPVYRCARGSTSLDMFHHYMCRFIPGVPASDLRYQVYLLEGLVRWNENHGEASVDGGQCSAPHCLSAQLQHSFNQLSHEFGLKLPEPYTQPKEYTGELIGVEYLYSQMGAVLQQDLGDPDVHDGTDVAEEEWKDGDEGEGYEEQPEEILLLEHHHALLQTSEASSEPATATPESVLKVSTFQSRSVHPPPSHDNDDGNPEMEVQETNKEEDVVRPDGNGGYHHTVALAHALVALRNEAIISQHQATQIIALWQRMTERDKAVGDPITSHQGTPTPGVDVLKRAVLGQAAKSPELSRLVEAIILELCRLHIQEINAIPQRWDSVMRDYRQIQKKVLNSPTLMAHTRMQLFVVSKWTLTLWHNQRGRAMMRETTSTAVPKANAPQTPPPGPQANNGIVTTASAITSACTTRATPTTCAITSSSSSDTPTISTIPNTSGYTSTGIEYECKTELSTSPTLICKEQEILPVQIKQEDESDLKESASAEPVCAGWLNITPRLLMLGQREEVVHSTVTGPQPRLLRLAQREELVHSTMTGPQPRLLRLAQREEVVHGAVTGPQPRLLRLGQREELVHGTVTSTAAEGTGLLTSSLSLAQRYTQ
ncbi:hypothetical protein ACEWY4_021911 [Coilia grayii]|uniref:Transposase n=1 Tax=Coilia grayii TaxID=363190 RepID=A0ABD1J4I1_9TELE